MFLRLGRASGETKGGSRILAGFYLFLLLSVDPINSARVHESEDWWWGRSQQQDHSLGFGSIAVDSSGAATRQAESSCWRLQRTFSVHLGNADRSLQAESLTTSEVVPVVGNTVAASNALRLATTADCAWVRGATHVVNPLLQLANRSLPESHPCSTEVRGLLDSMHDPEIAARPQVIIHLLKILDSETCESHLSSQGEDDADMAGDFASFDELSNAGDEVDRVTELQDPSDAVNTLGDETERLVSEVADDASLLEETMSSLLEVGSPMTVILTVLAAVFALVLLALIVEYVALLMIGAVLCLTKSVLNSLIFRSWNVHPLSCLSRWMRRAEFEMFGRDPLVLGPGSFGCSSTAEPRGVVEPSKKGLAVDDVTFWTCPNRMVGTWPLTSEPVKTIRLYHAGWASSWASFAPYLWSTGARVLLGTRISCDEAADDADWGRAKAFMRLVGSRYIMGLSIGNEIDLLQYNGASADCLGHMWAGGYYARKFHERVAEMDEMGLLFSMIPVTAVFAGNSFGGDPFLQTPRAGVLDFLRNVTEVYGARYAFSFNLYPYFDPANRLDVGTPDQCSLALARSMCFGSTGRCALSNSIAQARVKMQQLTGDNDRRLWLGETGWASHVCSSLATDHEMRRCPDYSSQAAQSLYYDNFLSWDLSAGVEGGVDHVFYFTVRDIERVADGFNESFGLLSSCTNHACKRYES